MADLADPFEMRLKRSEAAADERLDEILSEGDEKIVRLVPLNLKTA